MFQQFKALKRKYVTYTHLPYSRMKFQISQAWNESVAELYDIFIFYSLNTSVLGNYGLPYSTNMQAHRGAGMSDMNAPYSQTQVTDGTTLTSYLQVRNPLQIQGSYKDWKLLTGAYYNARHLSVYKAITA